MYEINILCLVFHEFLFNFDNENYIGVFNFHN